MKGSKITQVILLILALTGVLCALSACSKQETIRSEVAQPPQTELYNSAEIVELESPPPLPEETPLPEPDPEPEPEPVPEPVLPENCVRVLEMDAGVTYVIETETEADGVRLTSRSYEGWDGCDIAFLRARGASAQPVLFQKVLSVPSGTLYLWDAVNLQWGSQPLAPGVYPGHGAAMTLDDGSGLFFYLPKTYRTMERTVMQHLLDRDGSLMVEEKEDGSLTVSVLGGLLEEGQVCDALVLTAPWPIDNWDSGSCANAVTAFTSNREQKWCFDGFYFQVPYNYEPNGENCYYRCTASFLTAAVVRRMPRCKAASHLSVAMLETIAQHQNELGYWPTEPRSAWLYADFQIDAGFYDTRFNTDLMECYTAVRKTLGLDLFREETGRYVDFYRAMAESNHRETENGGWFVADYWQDEPFSMPHTSLNHQIAEAILLYKLADLDCLDDLSILADKMMLAVEDTGPSWIRSDGSLHYAILPDGTFGMQDYPYLTYNDLYTLQKYYTTSRGAENETLSMLMDSKLASMIALGITGYYGG